MNVLMLLDNSFTNDRRVYREAKTLINAGYKVEIICVKTDHSVEKEKVSGIDILRLIDQQIFDIKNTKYKKWLACEISKRKFDVLHCHDQEMLNLGVKIKQKKRLKFNEDIVLIYDSHELFHSYPLNIEISDKISILVKSFIIKKIQVFREKWNSRYIDYIITVNTSLSKDLTNYLRLKNKPTVIRNIPEVTKVTHNKVLRTSLNVPDSSRILVFIGVNIFPKTLNLEQVISEFKDNQDTYLVFIAKKNAFQKDIETFVTQMGADNILFHDIVHPAEIIQYLSSCDVGLVPTWNKKDLSYWYALDNKLFEYLMAEIPILATQQPEYVNIVDKYKIGICINPDEEGAYLKGFNQIIKNYDFYKENTKLAKEELNWNNEKQELLNLYQKISANLSA
jgi:glycosyltransferase involved in cell wall biosynthesis